ncbi:MAG TPA: accessory gene regulator B family protein, partial [Clostridia bacterium]|nr:accessory gene regulator B family protein [Clostridia bacterium]
LSFVFSYLVVYKKAPVDSPNKPVRKEKKIRRLRIGAFITLTIYFIAVAVLYYFSGKDLRFSGYAISVTMAVLWQIFMLTGPGHKFMQVIDRKMVDF